MEWSFLDLDIRELSGSKLSESPLRVLVELYLTDCEARNLQPATMGFYRARLDLLVEAMGRKLCREISTAHLRLLLNHLKENRKWNAQNINHCIQVWKGLFNYLEREEVIEQNPARRLQKLRQESTFPKPFSSEQIEQLFRSMPRSFAGIRDRVMILVLLDTGIRLAELVDRTTVQDIDFALGQLRVYGKGRKERFVPFEATVRRALTKWLALRSAIVTKRDPREQALWITTMGTALSQDTFQYNLRQYGRTAGIEHVHPHRFRHTFATEYLRNGGSPTMLQRILGHTTPMMVQRYVHIVDSDVKVNHRQASPVEAWRIK
jgi:integrase/recombinase XerD